MGRLEVDLWAWDPRQAAYVVIEVRGAGAGRDPIFQLTREKRWAMERGRTLLRRRYRRKVRLELVQIVGEHRGPFVWTWACEWLRPGRRYRVNWYVF